MQSFVAEFPVQQSTTAQTFVTAVREWLLGSRHTRLTAQNFEGFGQGDDWSFKLGDESIESLRVASPNSDTVAIRYKKFDSELEWNTSVVFSGQPSSSWVSVRVTCDSIHPAARLPAAKKPVLIRTLLTKLGGGADGQLDVSNFPVMLDDSDIDFAARCILGDVESYLPLVYVSAKFQGGYLVDVKELADDLSGMAHVVVEPNRAFSVRLMNDVSSQNVYGGTVGIYWPEGGGRRSFFIGRELASASEIEKAICDEVRSALNNRRPLPRCTWTTAKEANSRRVIKQLKEAGSTEIEKYISAFDDELKSKSLEIQEAEREIQRLKADVRKYEAQSSMRTELSIKIGQEHDLYPGELLDIVHDTFTDALPRTTTDSRRQHVLNSIVSANDQVGEGAALRERLKATLRNYTSMDPKIRKTLEEIGFGITDSGKHFKLVFGGDDRYTFTLSKSGSDFRGGLNAASDISRLLF